MKTTPKPFASRALFTLSFGLALGALAPVDQAQAHFVFDQQSAPAGSSYRGVLRVRHGCDGLPTTGISVHIPAGVEGAKPMPKPGWRIALQTKPQPVAAAASRPGEHALADHAAHAAHAARVRVTDIAWTATSAGAALPNDYFDEFLFIATLPAKPGPLWFKVVQTCDDQGRQVRTEWTQIPESGTDTSALTTPAALLQVEPAASGSATMHHHE